MKKLLRNILTAACILSMTACAANGGSETPSGTAPAVGNLSAEGGLSGEITVAAYDSMMTGMFLEEAASLFMEKYPDTKVNVSTASAMPEIRTSGGGGGGGMSIAVMDNSNNEQAISDYVSKVGTELMSGGGADVYAMDVLPSYKYADSKMLEDLTAYMDADENFNRNDYYTNILDAMKYNGGQYVFPMDFDFSFISYNKDLLTDAQKSELQKKDSYTYDELAAIAGSFEKSDDETLFGSYGGYTMPNNIVRSFLELNQNSLYNLDKKEAYFDKGTFSALVKKADEYLENGYVKTPPDLTNMGGRGGDGVYSFSSDSMTSGRMLRGDGITSYYNINSFNSLMNFFQNDEQTGRIMMRAMAVGGSSTDNDEVGGILTGDNGEAAFTTSQAYAMNANSKNKALAWEFIKFLASEDMQTAFYIQGSPVHIESSHEKIKQNLTGSMFSSNSTVFQEAENFVNGETAASEGTPENSEGAAANSENAPENSENAPANSETPVSGNDNRNGGGMGDIIGANGSINFRGIGDMLGSNRNREKVVLDADQQKVYDEYIKVFNKFVGMLNTCYIPDSIIEAAVETELTTYYNGSRTIEEVAKALQNRVGLYLAE